MHREAVVPQAADDLKEFAAINWAREWNALRTVSDRSGGQISIPGRPWHFAGEAAPSEDQLPARQGEHNIEVLTKLGYSTAAIAALHDSGALIQPGRVASADDAADPVPRAAGGEAAASADAALQGGEESISPMF
jgi:hypothetical protein